MTREILFRGKRIDNGEWVEGNLFIPDIPNTPTQICIGTNVARITYDVIPETVGQYTGLTDKNGKKIFEGDIVKYKANATYLGRFFECIGNVEYNEKSAFYAVDAKYAKNYDYFPLRCEVIGNKWDNSELLEEKI